MVVLEVAVLGVVERVVVVVAVAVAVEAAAWCCWGERWWDVRDNWQIETVLKHRG